MYFCAQPFGYWRAKASNSFAVRPPRTAWLAADMNCADRSAPGSAASTAFAMPREYARLWTAAAGFAVCFVGTVGTAAEIPHADTLHVLALEFCPIAKQLDPMAFPV